MGAGEWSKPLDVLSGAGVPDAPVPIECTHITAHSVLLSWPEPLNNGAKISEYVLECQHPGTDYFSQVRLH